MKKLKYVLPALVFAMGLTSCRNDIDLNNIDTKMQLNTPSLSEMSL